MGFFNFLKKSGDKSNTRKIGHTDAVCPYCDKPLSKMPGKKTKCPECGNFIYVRTRPEDQKKVLVTEADVQQIEEQWSIVNVTHAEYLAKKNELEDEKARLTNQFGMPPSDNDVKWAMLNKQLLDHAKNGDWGLYRNTKYEMAEILRKESRLEAALATYLEVCYIDSNGPQNSSNLRGSPFSPDKTFFAPGIINAAVRLIKKLNFDMGQTHKVFQRVADINYESLNLPVTPQKCWEKLKSELFAD